MAVVYFIHKKESKMKLSNYTPISILTLASKIIENLINKRQMDFFNKHEITYKHQFGFQRGKSTEHAVLDLFYNIVSALETKDKACSIFLDFAKAFYTVNHDILLSQLGYYGVCGLSLKLLKSCLSDRTQCVKIGGSTSKQATTTFGVPQGSVLWPLLFFVYISDIHKSDSEASFHPFADDASLSFTNKNVRRLEAKVNTSPEKITIWLKANKLTLNIDISKLLFFDLSPNTNKADALNIQIKSHNLEQSKSVRYLGVVINNKLNWKSHIEYINHKINIGLGIIKKLRYYVQEETLN